MSYIHILKEIRNENVNPFIGILQDMIGNTISIVYEHCPRGSLTVTIP